MTTIFETRLFGYSKKSVCDYIERMNEEFSQKSLAREREHKETVRILEEQLTQLRQENERLHAMKQEVADALIEAKAHAAGLIVRAEEEARAARVEGTLREFSGQELAGLTLRFMAERPQKSVPVWLLIAGPAAAALLLAVIVVLAVKLRRLKKSGPPEEWIDPVTGIGNRAYFIQFFEHELSDPYWELCCVAYIGFDIARVNRYYGPEQAEEQLRFAARELFASTRDNELVARVSGGGFAVVRPTSGEAEAGEWADKLLSRLDRYTEKYGKDYRPTFSMGIYMLSSSDRDGNAVLFNAERGYDLAVSTGVPYTFSHPEYLDQENKKLQLKQQSMDAIRDGQFKLFMQFIVYMDGSIYGAETLSRWDHPQRGLLSPGSYVDLLEAEQTIPELDFYMFEETCRQLDRWGKQGRKLSLSCNFTRITLAREDFIPRLEEIMSRYTFDPSRLVLEITEDTIAEDKELSFENVSRSKAMGFRIALDDMGSGYTSFSDLRDYPLDIVKIDSTILHAAVDDKGIALLKGMITLSHGLGLDVLCEGIETAGQVDLLRRLNCDRMQGYYFYRALPREEAERLL